MSNHFHLLVKSIPGEEYSDEEIIERLVNFYGKNKKEFEKNIRDYRLKLEDISEYMKSIKMTFTRWYNREKRRRGYFWGDRFKSVLVEKGEALLNMLAYIDLNPIRAGIVKKPEGYRWSSIGYYIGIGNKDNFLSIEEEFGDMVGDRDFLKFYRSFVYLAGGIEREPKGKVSEEILENEEGREFSLGKRELFAKRIRYFTDGLVIGSKRFVKEAYNRFGGVIIKKKERRAHKTGIGEKIFSIRRLCLDL